MPANVLTIVHEQATRIASNNSQTLSLGLVIGILASLWSTMSGVKALIDALNVIYEQRESRSFIKLNVVALVFTLFGFAAFLLAMVAIVVLPLVLSPIGFGNLTETIARIARWPVLLIVLLFGLAILYRDCPNRRAARWQWVSVGSVFATLTWFVASFLFSWYLASFANYNATYGSLGAVVGLMIWLWISTVVVLLGAELNAEIEHQTARNSTVGADKPLGERGAVMAVLSERSKRRGRHPFCSGENNPKNCPKLFFILALSPASAIGHKGYAPWKTLGPANFRSWRSRDLFEVRCYLLNKARAERWAVMTLQRVPLSQNGAEHSWQPNAKRSVCSMPSRQTAS